MNTRYTGKTKKALAKAAPKIRAAEKARRKKEDEEWAEAEKRIDAMVEEVSKMGRKKKVKSVDDLRRMQKTLERQLKVTEDEANQGAVSKENVEEEKEYIKSIKDLRERAKKRNKK